MLRGLVKQMLLAVAPQSTTAILSARARSHAHRFLERAGIGELNQKLLKAFGPRVRSGPFAGMELTPMAHREQLGPFLLGTFEQELHPWLTDLLARPFRQVIDVGCAFGYYAVGFARQLPAAEVVAYDTDWWARRAVKEMAAANGVRNLTVEGYCTPARLTARLGPSTLVFSDCEGFEATLFLTPPAGAFAGTTMLIELHEAAAPGVTDRLRDRFRATHGFEVVGCGDRTVPGLDLGFLSAAERERAVYEIRGPQQWVLLSPRPTPEAR